MNQSTNQLLNHSTLSFPVSSTATFTPTSFRGLANPWNRRGRSWRATCGSIGATARAQADAPEIDGNVFLRDVGEGRKAGDILDVVIEDADVHDLYGAPANAS